MINNLKIMKIKYLIIVILSIAALTACGQQTDTEGATTEDIMDTVDELDLGYGGTWLRTGTYIDGALEHTTPADLTFNSNGTYDSATDVCTTSGTYEEIEDGTITMVMTESNCPGGLPLPYTLTYTYELNEDGMTLYVENVMETYVRQ